MENKLSIAKKLIENKHFEKAIDVLNDYKKENDTDWELFFELGKIYYINKQFIYAIKNFNSSFVLNKNNIFTKFLLAKSLKAAGFDFRALRLFLNIRKNNIDMKKEVDNEIISMLLNKKLYMVALKYIDIYLEYENILREKILKYLFTQIDSLNFKGEIKKAEILAVKALKKIKNLNDRNKNILLNEREISENKVKLKSFPRILEIELTQNCNLKCRMCNVCSKTNNYKELNEKQISILVDLLKYAETVIWIGGEPLIYKNIENLFDIANKANVRQEIITNGLLLTKQLIRKIINYDMKLTLSIDSVNKKIYENIRIGGNFNVLLNNIKYIYEYKKIKKSKKELVLNTVLSKWNYEYDSNFIEIINFANKYGFKTVNIYCDNFEYDKNLQKKYLIKFNLQRDILIKLADKFNINLNIDFASLDTDVNKDSNIKDFLCKFCLLPWKKMYIRFNGIVTIDCRCPNIGILSKYITKDFLIDNIWNGKQMLNYRNKIINNDLKDIKRRCLSDISLRKG